ncbi:MAG: hypothetical protein ACPG8W_11870 [Candidatus Promineifilaceae bacterium]
MREKFIVTEKRRQPRPKQIRTTLYSHKKFDTVAHATNLFNYLLSKPMTAPTHWGEASPLRRINKKSKLKFINQFAKIDVADGQKYSLSFFERKSEPVASYRVTWSDLEDSLFESSTYRISPDDNEELFDLEKWIDFSLGLIEMHDAYYASILLDAEFYDKNMLQYREQISAQFTSTAIAPSGTDLSRGVPSVYWGNYFSSFYVDWFGREKFETLPCFEKTWLDNGGIFFTIAPTLFDWDTSEARLYEHQIKQHLGEKAFFDLDTVCTFLEHEEPLAATVSPEFLQPPRWIPDFPFEYSRPSNQPYTKYAPTVMKQFYDDPITMDQELRAAYPQNYT